MRAAVVAGIVVALVACTSKKQPPVANHSPLADSADQVMYNSRFVLADLGINRAQMHSDTAYFFDDNTRMEFENPVVTFFTATGAKDATLTSRHGTYNNRTSNMIARKNVVVVSEDGRRLTTEELIYNQQRNEISSDSAFLLSLLIHVRRDLGLTLGHPSVTILVHEILGDGFNQFNFGLG